MAGSRIPPRYRDTDIRAVSARRPAWLEKILRLGVSFGLAADDGPRLSRAEHGDMYEPLPSFARFLPVRAWDPESRLFLLQDWPSAAAILELDTVDAEARSPKQLETMLDQMASAFGVIPQRSKDPWIVQLYLQDEPLLDAARKLDEYAARIGSVQDRFSRDFHAIMRSHLMDIGKPGGIFEDVTGVRWGGRVRRCRLVLYCRFDPAAYPDRAGRWPVDEVDDLAQHLSLGLSAAGIQSHRIAPGAFSNWMFPWLNPVFAGRDAWDHLAEHGDPDEREFLPDFDLCHAALKHHPKSDAENGVWWFSDRPHRYLPAVGFRTEPRAGLLTLEKSAGRGRTAAAFFDRLPTDTVFTLQFVITPQDEVSFHLEFIARRSRSDNPRSVLVRGDVADCQAALAEGNHMFPTVMGFFVRGQDLHDLEDRLARIQSLCTNEGIETVDPGSDLFPLDEYVRYLPAGYSPGFDRWLMRERHQWLANAMAASPLWGKAQGSGKPGVTFFDRAGQPVQFDVLHPEDRDKAPHCLILGPTGTGKSALMNYLAMQVMAIHRPHLYIVDVGDSFRLIGDFFRSRGLKVNHVRLDRDDVSLPPFSSSPRLLEQEQRPAVDGGEDGPEVSPEDDHVDYLGEMEAAAQMIITGLDPKEELRFSRSDRTYVRSALIDAARAAHERGAPHATVSDFVRILEEYAGGRVPAGFENPVDGIGAESLATLNANARLFLDGVRNRIFNRPGDPWPEADVTIVDFGRLAKDDQTRDILSIAFIGLMNVIQRDAEARRGSGRQSVVMIDEAHITTTNPHLAGYLIRGAKMWRKWGLWLWMATQSLQDFPDETRQILNMCEFWFCLSMPKEEIEEISRFRRLTEEDRLLLEEARRAPGRYSEGVLLSGRPPMLFRNVPPAIAMALSQTEESEVAERLRLMDEHGLETELEAVDLVAEQIRERRLS